MNANEKLVLNVVTRDNGGWAEGFLVALSSNALRNTLRDLDLSLKSAKDAAPLIADNLHSLSVLVNRDAFAFLPEIQLQEDDSDHLRNNDFVVITDGLDSRRWEIQMIHLYSTGYCFWLELSVKDADEKIHRLITKPHAPTMFFL